MELKCSRRPCSDSRHSWKVFLTPCVTFRLFLFPVAQKRTEQGLWDLLPVAAQPGGDLGAPTGDAPGPSWREGSRSAPSIHIRKQFQKSFYIPVPTLGLFGEVTVCDTQLGSGNTTKSTFWHWLPMRPKPGAGFLHGGKKSWAASWCCLLARQEEGSRLPQRCCVSSPSQQELLRGDAAALRWVAEAPARLFLDQRKPESWCLSDWRHLQLCNMQFQCLKLWEFNRALEDFNIHLKSMWQVLNQQHNSLNVRQSSDEIHL